MRQFVAGLCCAIVGLEVLVGVPLVTCLVMFVLFEGGDLSPVAMEVNAASAPADFPCPVPCVDGPAYASSPPVTPVGLPTITFPQPATCPPPSTTADSCPPPVTPTVEAIADARQRIGSPLDSSIVAPQPTVPLPADEFIANVEQLASDDSIPAIGPQQAPAFDPRLHSAPCVVPPSGGGSQQTPHRLPEMLHCATQQLYDRAQELEIAGHFARADQIRQLARQIRSEIDVLRREEAGVAPTPSTVTEASFNPEPPTPTNLIGPPATAELPPIEAPSSLEKDPANPAP